LTIPKQAKAAFDCGDKREPHKPDYHALICCPNEWDGGQSEEAEFDPSIDGAWMADSEEDF